MRARFAALLPIAAAFGIWLMMPGSAAGSCGDHVLILPAFGTQDPPAAPNPCPCRGPSCEQLPVAPAPTPASTIQLTHPLDAIVSVASTGADLPVVTLSEHDVPTRAGLALAIFHPPR